MYMNIVRNLKIDKVYASDLLRAYHTAVPTAEKLGMEIQKEPRFREIYAGDWEGLHFDMIREKFQDTYGIWLNNIGEAHPDNGESVAELGERIMKCLKELALENQDKNILIATHATPIRVVRCMLSGLPFSEMKNIPWAANASLTTLSNNKGELKLEEYGFNTYLGDMVTRFSANV